jgi:dinuclear metal center YbgI/SA1388 family protein
VPEPVRLSDVVTAMEHRYDPSWAEPWDAVGLVAGDPDQPVGRVLFAVDPVAAVAAEAIKLRADLLVAHHPLFLTPVHSVAATMPKGLALHRLTRAGVALFVAHTNAAVACPGVSDALADALGLEGATPLSPAAPDPLDKLVVFVPDPDVAGLIDALSAAGAGEIGHYRRCAWTTTGIGTFLPTGAARPAVGRLGRVESVPETRVEMVLPRARRTQVVRALRAAHPYEEPAFDLLELATPQLRRGLGRVGELAHPMSLAEFADRAAAALPPTSAGLRLLGDLAAPVRRVAVCGGAGGELAAAARAAGADVLVTADLRHHPASELAEDGGLALVDAPHWATEQPWLSPAARRLREDLTAASDGGITVEVAVSRLVTDPWTAHVPSSPQEQATLT